MSENLPDTVATILKALKQKKTTVKTAVYGSQYANKKQLMFIVSECLKYYHILEEVLDSCNLQSSDKRLKNNRQLAILLLHRHLLAAGGGLNGSFSKFKKVIESQKSAIHSAVVRVKIKHKIKHLSEAAITSHSGEALPRYIRVNTLCSTLDKVLESFKSEGYTTIKSTDIADNLAGSKWMAIDDHIENVIALPPKVNLHDHQLVESGSIILQDKASCMPAYVLNPEPGSHVVDGCAAPGNKTSHLAAILGNKGSITAYELNKKRCKTLRTMLSKAQVSCCRVENADFTHCDVTDYKNVEYVLVDPSCSGSGIVSRSNPLSDDEETISPDRLDKLASFQSVILKKALSFPNVKKVVYSTCSIHSKENEEVVRDVLEQFGDKFTLEDALPSWPVRGVDLDGRFPLGTRCLRASPESSMTIGFFVALLVKIPARQRAFI